MSKVKQLSCVTCWKILLETLCLLPSHVVCMTCRSTIRTAACQKERFKQTRRSLVQKLHAVAGGVSQPSSSSLLNATAETPPRHNPPSNRPKPPEKRTIPSPLVQTGVSPLLKRHVPGVSASPQKELLVSSRRVKVQGSARRELFEHDLSAAPLQPSRIPVLSVRPRGQATSEMSALMHKVHALSHTV